MDYLVHHGIKGQKWGIRRFQNENGSYTDAGKQRRAGKIASVAAANAFRKDVRKTKFAGDTAYEKDKSNSSRIARSASKGLNSGKETVKAIQNERQNRKKSEATANALEEARNMTDEQLKQRIARLNLENNYVNAINQQQTTDGRDTVDAILGYTGTILGIAGAGLGIYATIKGLNK